MRNEEIDAEIEEIDPNEILELTTEFFKAKFNKEDDKTIEPFKGEAKPLNCPISPEEVRQSFKKLNNNRATGEDEITGELLKYSPEDVTNYVADMFNEVFESHQPLKINNGNMRALQKPGKPKGPRKISDL